MKGRPRIPTTILKARGSWRADTEDRKREPQYADGVPDCPEFLSGEARDEWNRLAVLMGEQRTLTKADRASLTAFCETWADFVDSCAEYKAATGKSKRLARISKRLCTDALLKAAAQFGLTPSARSRVQSIEGKNASDGNKARFFKAS